MLVVLVEGIEVARVTGSLARGAKRQLAQPANLLEQVRNRIGVGAIHRIVTRIDEQARRRQARDLAREIRRSTAKRERVHAPWLSRCLDGAFEVRATAPAGRW